MILDANNRRSLVDQVLRARSLEQIEHARRAVRMWLEAYPNDEGMPFALDHLARMQDAIEAITASSNSPS